MRRPALLLVSLLLPLLAALPPATAAPERSEPVAPVGTWPLRPAPEVVRGFDPPSSAWGAGHRGVDLLGAPGQVVRATLSGTVTHAGTLAGRGVVVVSHGSTRTTYEPVESRVEVGTAVGAGDRLGTLQAAPSHCVPRTCLHWGWIAGETYLDPLRLVGLGPVRLLPYLSGTRPGGTPSATGAAAPASGWRPLLPAPPVPFWW